MRPIPPELKGLVPAPTDKNVTLKKTTPDVEGDTMPLIIAKTRRTAWQTKKLAAALKGSTMAETLRNDSNFILDYIRYVKDDPNHEQVRSPRRLVYDGKGDCDCFAVFLGTLLANQGIKFSFRIARYNSPEWSHIYLVVPKNQSGSSDLTRRADYVVLDPVTNRHDHEASFTDKRDFNMALQYLDGIGFGSSLGACSTSEAVTPFNLRTFVDTDEIIAAGLVPTKMFLEEKCIPYEQRVDLTSNKGYFIVLGPNGQIPVSPVITKEQAAQLETAMVPQATKVAEQPKATNWFPLVLSSIGVLLTKKPEQAMPSPGLSGLGRKLPVARRPQRKIHTVNI